MGILQAAEKLHEESLDLSQVREFLEYPEPFRFEGGTAIPKADAYELKLSMCPSATPARRRIPSTTLT